MPPRTSPRPPRFYVIVLATGFIVGGLLTQVARRFMPSGSVKQFLTADSHICLLAGSVDMICCGLNSTIS